ncbi:MAG: hypothetical protein WBP45_07115 [Daejeonella sp.]
MDMIFEWTIPSKKENELKRLIGHKILSMVKTSYETFQEHLNYLDEVGEIDYRDRLSFFKYSYGGLLIFFDNDTEYYFGSAEDLNSVIMGCQKNINGKYNENYILDDKDVLDKTSVSDFFDNDFKKILNQKIRLINILTTNNLNGKEQCVPSEKGIEFIFENNKKLILSHNLTENSFVFAVLTERDKISLNTIIKKMI